MTAVPMRVAMSPVLMSAAALIGRQSLDNTIPSQHTSIHGEVSTDHKRTHSRVLLCKPVRLISEICLIFPAIDENQAGKSR